MGLARILAMSLVCVAAVGCDSSLPVADDAPSVAPLLATQFDAESCGSISGHVWWSGPVPSNPIVHADVLGPDGKWVSKQFINPNRIQVAGQSQSIENAIVFLENVEPERAHPWDHEPVRIEIDEQQIRVHQGHVSHANVGVVHTGDEVKIVSRQNAVNVLSARGAAFFGLALPDPNIEVERRFDKPGLVELSSGAGRYWHRAYLWVTDHPYFAATDADGRFALSQIPAGEYRLIAWHSNGDVANVDRDPNTGMVLRYHFAEPFRSAQTVRVVAGKETKADCLLSK